VTLTTAVVALSSTTVGAVTGLLHILGQYFGLTRTLLCDIDRSRPPVLHT